MSNTGFDFGKFTALGLVLAVCFAQGTSGHKVSRPAAADGPDFSSEARTIDSFSNDLANFDKKRGELSKKASLTNEEVNALDRTGQDLKRRVSGLRDAVQTVIRKLKAAGRWDNLDQELTARLTHAEDRAFLRDNGGLKRILEDGINQLNSQTAEEITAPLSSLRAKVARHRDLQRDRSTTMSFRLVAARYDVPAANPAVPLATRTLRCVGATIRYGVGLAVHGYDPQTGKSKGRPGGIQAYQCNCSGVNCAGAAVE